MSMQLFGGILIKSEMPVGEARVTSDSVFYVSVYNVVVVPDYQGVGPLIMEGLVVTAAL
jgi:hypothetical protein